MSGHALLDCGRQHRDEDFAGRVCGHEVPNSEHDETLLGLDVVAGDDADRDDFGREQAVDHVGVEAAEVRSDERALGQAGAGQGQQFDHVHTAADDDHARALRRVR